MRILGIETSCDETAAAIIDITASPQKPRLKILSNVVSSQVKLHAKFGGVVPHLAKREHQRNLAPVLLTALKEAGLVKSKTKNQKSKTQIKIQKAPSPRRYTLSTILEREPELLARMVEYILPLKTPKIDAIAVTAGPGLAPALWVGVNFARALGFLWGKPLIPVNHLEGHIYTNLIPSNWPMTDNQFPISNFQFPVLCLIVSGGHTELVLMRGYGKYRVIGETLDDAAGEAFDKAARMLGLGFPGGPEIAAEAEKIQNDPEGIASRSYGAGKSKFKIKLPRPMINSRDYNFSFSGLKTAVLYLLRDLRGAHPLSKIRPHVAAEFQNAVADVLAAKTVRAAKQYRARTVMIGGGVAANKKLRDGLGQALKQSLPESRYLAPDASLSGDNALMIALAGYFNRRKKTSRTAVQADANLRLER